MEFAADPAYVIGKCRAFRLRAIADIVDQRSPRPRRIVTAIERSLDRRQAVAQRCRVGRRSGLFVSGDGRLPDLVHVPQVTCACAECNRGFFPDSSLRNDFIQRLAASPLATAALRVREFFDPRNSASGVILSRRAARAVSKDLRAALPHAPLTFMSCRIFHCFAYRVHQRPQQARRSASGRSRWGPYAEASS